MYNKILLNQLIQNGGDNVLEQLNSQSIKSNGLNNNISSFGRSESNFKPKSTINSYKEIRKLPLLKVRTTKEGYSKEKSIFNDTQTPIKLNNISNTIIYSNINNQLFIQRLNFNNPELRESESACSFYYNHKSQKSTIRSIYGIYWDKKTINKVWNKLKLIKEKVHQKSKADYSFISNAIQNNQDEFILTYLKDEKFK